MFKCKGCGHTDFNLVLQPGFAGTIEIESNDLDEVVVCVHQNNSTQKFVADMLFMNQFAVCKHCTGIKKWEYFFPKKLSSANS